MLYLLRFYVLSVYDNPLLPPSGQCDELRGLVIETAFMAIPLLK